MFTFISKSFAIDRIPVQFNLEYYNFRRIISNKIFYILKYLFKQNCLIVVWAPNVISLHADADVEGSDSAGKLFVNTLLLALGVMRSLNLSLISKCGRVMRPRHCQLPDFHLLVFSHPVVSRWKMIRVLQNVYLRKIILILVCVDVRYKLTFLFFRFSKCIHGWANLMVVD